MTPPIARENHNSRHLSSRVGPVNLPEPAAVGGEIVGPGDLMPTGVRYDPWRHPALVYLQTLPSETSRTTMRRALDQIAALLTAGRCDHLTLPWHLVRYEHTSAVAARVVRAYAPATANKILSGLSRVVWTCWQLGYYDAETRDRARDYPRATGRRLVGAAAGRQVYQQEIAALFASCAAEGGALARRDAALLAVLYAAGVRREEIVRLNLADLDHGEARLTVHGKRDKVRTTYLDDDAMFAVLDWLTVRGRQPGPLFAAVLKSGRVATPLRRLSTSGVYQALDRRRVKAGVARFSPHDMRRTLIGDLLDGGVDLVTVSEIVGHSSTNTTARYNRRGERAKKQAARVVQVPYQRTTAGEDDHAA